jgi:hypothetical protein
LKGKAPNAFKSTAEGGVGAGFGVDLGGELVVDVDVVVDASAGEEAG